MSSKQTTAALYSAELYALINGAGQTLGLMFTMADLGVKITASVHTDASAAIRARLGKSRHLNVRYLFFHG